MSRYQAKIADLGTEAFQRWQPELALPLVSPEELKYSLGFLRFQPERWFESLAAHWQPLCHSLGVSLCYQGSEMGFDFPSEPHSVTPLEVDGEMAVLCMDQETESLIIEAVVPEISQRSSVGGELIIEYLERRLVASISRSWPSFINLPCYFLSPEQTDSVEVVAAIKLCFQLEDKNCILWFGIGRNFLQRLDAAWREYMHESSAIPGLTDGLHSLEIVLAQFSVPPSQLIDYLRSGKVIELDAPLGTQVGINLDGQPWGQGALFQFNGKFVVRLDKLEVESMPLPAGSACVGVSIGEVLLDREAVLEHAQSGAFLATAQALNSPANLSIKGESVGKVLLGEKKGCLTLNVLPKD